MGDFSEGGAESCELNDGVVFRTRGPLLAKAARSGALFVNFSATLPLHTYWAFRFGNVGIGWGKMRL